MELFNDYLANYSQLPYWLSSSAPGILKKYFKWLFEKGFITKGAMEEIIEITKSASKDLPRVERVASMIY